MKLFGSHKIGYHYDLTVDINPHILRLKPYEGQFQKLISFEWNIFPEPSGHCWIRDGQQNESLQVWFNQKTNRLLIETRWEVETLLENPFQFLLGDYTLPMTLPADFSLGIYPELVIDAGAEVTALSRELATYNISPQGFVQKATQWICNNIQMKIRPESGTMSADAVLASRSGACRDMAWLLIQLCRMQGMPAIFVSGYCYHGSDHTIHDLHAWVEVWIPFGGWRGYDPSLGLAVSDRHVTLVRAPTPHITLPLEGSFLGGGNVEMSYNVDISAESEKSY